MSSTTERRRYHVVCRDCRTERVTQAASTAEAFVDRHAEETGHVVVFEPVE